MKHESKNDWEIRCEGLNENNKFVRQAYLSFLVLQVKNGASLRMIQWRTPVARSQEKCAKYSSGQSLETKTPTQPTTRTDMDTQYNEPLLIYTLKFTSHKDVLNLKRPQSYSKIKRCPRKLYTHICRHAWIICIWTNTTYIHHFQQTL